MRMLVALTITAALSGAAAVTPVLAEGPPAGAVLEQAVATRIQSMGYDVGALLRHDDHFHFSLTDRTSGGRVDAAFSAADGELLEAKPADYDENDD